MERVRGPFFRVANPAHIARIEITLADPAVLVVLRHALLGESHHLIERTRAACVEEGLEADHLIAACVVALVKLVPTAEFRAYRVPEQFHDLDPLLVFDPVRAAHILLQIFVDVGILEI